MIFIAHEICAVINLFDNDENWIILFFFKLFAKLQATKQEIADIQEEHSKERQELEQTQMELTRDLKLKWVLQGPQIQVNTTGVLIKEIKELHTQVSIKGNFKL